MIHDDSVPNQSTHSYANTMTKTYSVEMGGESVEIDYSVGFTTMADIYIDTIVNTTELQKEKVETLPAYFVVGLAKEILQSHSEKGWI